MVNEEILENEIVDMFGNRLNQHYKSIDFEGNEYYNLPKSYYGLIKLEYYANNPEDESRYKLMDRFKIDVLVNNYMIVRKRLFNSDLPLDHHDIQTLMCKHTIPNVLIYGPEGIGKTTLVNCMCAQRDARDVMYYDAVADHSLRGIRDVIKMFAKCRAVGESFKLIIIDDAYQLYPDAQAFLRRVMEIYAKTTRFVFIMRDMHKLTEPIQSRCMILHMIPASNVEIVKYLGTVCKKEEVATLTREQLTDIAKQADGSYRKALTLAETAAIVGLGSAITMSAVLGVPANMREFLTKLGMSPVIANIYKFMKNEILDHGFNPAQIMETILAAEAWPTHVYIPLARAVSDIRAGRHTNACILSGLIPLAMHLNAAASK